MPFLYKGPCVRKTKPDPAIVALETEVADVARAVALYGTPILPAFRRLESELERRREDRRALDRIVDATPIKRMGQPSEIAELVCFLLSDESSFISGQTMVIDGGRVTLP